MAVLHDENRHRGGRRAGHRADGRVMMTGVETHGPSRDEALGVFPCRREPLVDQRADDPAAHGSTHALPADGRPGVEYGIARHARHHLDRGAHVDEDLVGGEHPIERDAIRRVDLVAPERREPFGPLRRTPVDPPHRNALGDQRRREELRADHDGRRRLVEQIALSRHGPSRRASGPSRQRSGCSRTRSRPDRAAPAPACRGPADPGRSRRRERPGPGPGRGGAPAPR